MKNMAKYIAWLLLCGILIGFGGCGEQPTDPTPVASSGENSEKESESEMSTSETKKEPLEVALSEAELLDKIEGGWIGEMAGVAWGAPTEFCYAARMIPVSAIPVWTPSMINDAFGQDDLYVEIPFLDTMKKEGVDCDPQPIAEAFGKTQFALWHANGMARENIRAGMQYPACGSYENNYHADDIDWQIECDFLGMLYPGMVREAAERAFELGHIMNYGDGVYGGVFITAMHSAAFTASSVMEICETGISVIPEGTQFRALLDDVMTHYKDGDSFEQNWRMLQNKWAQGDLCPELPGDSNIDAKLNSGYVLLGLLYGEGDMEKTIKLSIRCGQDSDCNPSSTGSILGNFIGAKKIDDKFKSELDRRKTKFSFTRYTYDGAVKLNYSLAEEQLGKSGAAKGDDGVWKYTVDRNYGTVPFEQWPDGVYVYFKASAVGNKLTFGEMTPYSKNEEMTGFTIDMGDGRVFRDVLPTSYTYEKPGTYTVKVTVTGEKGSHAEKTVEVKVTGRESPAANDTVIVCSVTAPYGGGSRDAGIICDGKIPQKGAPDTAQYDTYTLGDPCGNPDRFVYIGYVYETARQVSEVIFTEGNHFGNGGWFKDGTLQVEVFQNGAWVTAEIDCTPAYPNANDMGAFGEPYETFTLKLREAQTCEGVRISGIGGGGAGFISVAELDVK